MTTSAADARTPIELSAFSRWSLQRLAIQGYGGVSYEERRSFSMGLRLTTGLCLATFLSALAFGSAWALAALATVALVAGLAPRHPLDYVWQYGARHLVGGAPLPVNPPERRLAFLLAAPGVLLVAVLVGAGWTAAAWVASVPLVVPCATVTATHLCLPGTVAAVLRGKLGELWRETPPA